MRTKARLHQSKKTQRQRPPPFLPSVLAQLGGWPLQRLPSPGTDTVRAVVAVCRGAERWDWAALEWAAGSGGDKGLAWIWTPELVEAAAQHRR